MRTTNPATYRRDGWQDQQHQQHHCEVWSEKGTVLGAIRPVTEQLGGTLRVSHGFGSVGMGLICFDTWNGRVAVQEVEFASTADFAAKMSALPQLRRGRHSQA